MRLRAGEGDVVLQLQVVFVHSHEPVHGLDEVLAVRSIPRLDLLEKRCQVGPSAADARMVDEYAIRCSAKCRVL